MKLSKNARKHWKEFEVLIAEVETVKRGKGAQVTWNDSIADKLGIRRQIDVSVRTPSPAGEQLTMIETRSRRRNNSIMWVDEVVGKRKTLPADEAIMVSATPFSKDAQRLASSEGIETRTFSELQPDPSRMMFPYKVEYKQVMTRREAIQVRLRRSSDAPLVESLEVALKAGESIAITFPDGESVELLDAADTAISQAPLPPMDPSFVSVRLVLSLLPRTIPVDIEFRGIKIPVAEITVEYTVELVSAEAETVWGHYRSADGKLDNFVERTEVSIRGQQCTFISLGDVNGSSFKVKIPREFANEDLQPFIDPIHGAQIEVYIDQTGQVNVRGSIND